MIKDGEILRGPHLAEKNTSKKEKKQDQLLRVLAVSFAVILLVMALVAVIYYSVPLKQAYRFSLDETELALQLGESADLEPVFTVIDQDKVRRTASRAKRKNVIVMKTYRSLQYIFLMSSEKNQRSANSFL